MFVLVVQVLALVGCTSKDTPSCEDLAPHMSYKQGRTPGSALRECRMAEWTADMRRCVVAAADHAAIRACGEQFGQQVAKPSEALVQLPRIASGALAAWKRDGAVPQETIGPTPSMSCCAQSNSSQPCAPQPALWSTWRALAFEMSGPFHLQYAYASAGKDAFTVTSIGDYDCDGIIVMHVLHGRIVGGDLQVQIDEPTTED